MRGQGWGTCDPRKGRGRAQDANGVRRTMGVSPAGPGMREREVESVPDRTLNLAAASSAAQRIPPTPLGSRTVFGEAWRAPRSAQTK